MVNVRQLEIDFSFKSNNKIIYEDWRYVIGYEGLYMVSNRGRVFSFGRVVIKKPYERIKMIIAKNRVLKHGKNQHYYFVNLCKYSITNNRVIHRLVAAVFIPNPENKPQVNHIDGNKLNNQFWNLEWVTIGENNAHAIRTGLRMALGQGKYNELHPRSRPVIRLSLNGEFLQYYPSSMEAERQGYIGTKITAACKGRRPNHKGFLWKYA